MPLLALLGCVRARCSNVFVMLIGFFKYNHQSWALKKNIWKPLTLFDDVLFNIYHWDVPFIEQFVLLMICGSFLFLCFLTFGQYVPWHLTSDELKLTFKIASQTFKLLNIANSGWESFKPLLSFWFWRIFRKVQQK